ncbi:hypothetical protein AC622_12985 [Bacillus sp. FJAT-27916]|uniref:YlqD family protein n=1 Tax=Bacillaceae TaxID=186817 RepID=UPI0006710460|nr:YlqD family protein [Bacillus sp. FJAT-27916]KMY45023.1 hypothetical protein AC622_12985 [Bacillus sp. FJAT-27916]
MKILQNVIVKQILTEKSKLELLDQFNSKKAILKKECDQLRFELKKLEKTKKFQPVSLKTHFEKEIDVRKEKIKLLDFQIQQLDILPYGSELKEREVQAIVDVEIGQNWEEIVQTKTIIVKDGVVDEFK